MSSKVKQVSGMKPAKARRARLGNLLTMGLLAGCDEQRKFAFPAANQNQEQAAAPTGPLIERDIEAPEIFSVTDGGLWDGRPSLGGVWVAHPDVTDPERVIIRNKSNGKFVRPNKCAVLASPRRSSKARSTARRSGEWLLALPQPVRSVQKFYLPLNRKASLMPMPFPTDT
tara:strand:+ start:234 stop:746 length:513 start_codon:yes stop_codon:yes gene_type:complete